MTFLPGTRMCHRRHSGADTRSMSLAQSGYLDHQSASESPVGHICVPGKSRGDTKIMTNFACRKKQIFFRALNS